MADKKPKVDDIKDLAKSLREAAADRDALFDEMDEIYDQGRFRDEQADDSVSLIQMPYGTNTIDLVTDLASQMKLTITVPAAKEHAKQKQEADDAEKWLAAWIAGNERLQQRNLTADAAWFGGQRSMVVMRTLFMDELLDESEDGTFKIPNVPVLLEVRDARYVYTLDGVLGTQKVMEIFERTVGDIRRHYPGALKDGNREDDELVQWVEYWDDKYRCYLADGEPIKFKGLGEVVPHGYGCLPYAIGVARSTPRPDAGKRLRPLLSATKSLLNNLDVWYSILVTAGQDAITNAWGVFSDSYRAAGSKQVNLSNGSVNYFAKDDKITPIQRSPLPPDFFQLGTLLMNAFQAGTFPFAVYGQTDGNVAGYAINLLQQSGRRPLIPIWSAIERAYAQAMRNCVTILREKVAPLVGDEIPLLVAGEGGQAVGRRTVKRELKLNTKAFGPDFDVTVSLSDPMPSDEAQNLRMALEATGGERQLLSLETARTKLMKIGDNQDEEQRIMAENIVRQLAPFEGLKLAIERGYVPQEVQLPPGYTIDEKGRIMPKSLMQPQGQPGQGQPGPMPMPQGLPQPGMEQAQADPAMLQQLMAMLSQQGNGVMPGATAAQPDPAMLQAMAAQSAPVSLGEMAGEAPPQPLGPGGF